MSCCPEIIAPSVINSSIYENNGVESNIRKGESVECYMRRAGNTTGQHDDATDSVENIIENTSITNSNGVFNITFRLTPNSTRIPNKWTWIDNNGQESISNLGVSLSLSGVLSGTAVSNAFGKKYRVIVTAEDASGIIDKRTYGFSVEQPNESTDIKLISPLPGAIINSKFGPRMHPIQKVMKPHTGIDMKYQDRSVKDVVAAGDGEVILAGGNPSSGYGLRVWIKHSNSNKVHICNTTYNHLAKIYVKEGQRVMAGQAIGLEGSTGASTGNHLHFEVRLPNNTFVDPEPLINGTVISARQTNTKGDAVPGSLETKNQNSSITKSDVEAKSTCEEFGPNYPVDPNETNDNPNSSPFEQAWYFTMKSEVSPNWELSYEQDPDVINGLIETKEQQKKCGYVNSPNYPGGETKFGIAQKPNPSTIVKTLNYSTAKKLGFNNYWKISTNPCDNKPKLVSIMLFDMNYLHGVGNARTIWNNALSDNLNINAVTKEEQLRACEILNKARINFIKSIPRPEYQRGWLNRAQSCYLYVKSLNV